MMMNTPTKHLADFTVHTKFKLAALWTSTMFLYVYGDYFQLYVPNHIQDLMDGKTPMGATSPIKVLIFGLVMVLPSLMISLSVFLKSNINRIVNILAGSFYTLIMLLIFVQSIGDQWLMFYSLYAAIESVLTLVIVRLAWKWEREVE
jgi:Family of unknown function (DUF6326)